MSKYNTCIWCKHLERGNSDDKGKIYCPCRKAYVDFLDKKCEKFKPLFDFEEGGD